MSANQRDYKSKASILPRLIGSKGKHLERNPLAVETQQVLE